MKRRTFLATAAASTLPLAAGCGGGGNGDGNRPSPSPTGTRTPAAVVTIGDEGFDPVWTSVDPGNFVRWENPTDEIHFVESAIFHDQATSWSVGEKLDPDEDFQTFFESEGVYEYVCTIHGEENECGVVLVGDVTWEEEMPCEGSGGDTPTATGTPTSTP